MSASMPRLSAASVTEIGADKGHCGVGPVVLELALERVTKERLGRLVVDRTVDRSHNPKAGASLHVVLRDGGPRSV
jgi:hypothetical protein